VKPKRENTLKSRRRKYRKVILEKLEYKIVDFMH